MKKNELALICVVVIIAGLTSYFILGAIMPKPSGQKATVKTVDPISATIDTPSTKIFNSSSIDPTVSTNIGDSSNQQPFDQPTR